MKKTRTDKTISEAPGLSVVVPCYNEGSAIPLVLQAFAKSLPVAGGVELIIVDNNSTDSTATILARELKKPEYAFARRVFEPRAGYGAAIKAGLAAARGKLLAWTHADLQTDPGDVFRAWAVFKQCSSPKTIVKGNRVGRPLSHVLFSAGMACIASILLKRRFFEINAQPKLFPHDFLPHLRHGPDDFSLDLYLLYQAQRRGYAVKTIDVVFTKRVFGESKWAFSFSSRIKTIWRTVRYVVRLKRQAHHV